jgi:hypothetical protein
VPTREASSAFPVIIGAEFFSLCPHRRKPVLEIEQTERLIAVYRNANEVIVGTEDQIYSRRGLVNR